MNASDGIAVRGEQPDLVEAVIADVQPDETSSAPLIRLTYGKIVACDSTTAELASAAATASTPTTRVRPAT